MNPNLGWKFLIAGAAVLVAVICVWSLMWGLFALGAAFVGAAIICFIPWSDM